VITSSLAHQIDRTIVIGAPPDAVFRYFTDPARWAAWWGAGSTIDARPGGRVFVRHPEGTEAAGDVIEVSPPSRIVFTYGYVSGTPVGPGTTRVTITLSAAPRGTSLHLRHEFADAAARDEHVQGWRYQLSVFANVVASELHADAPQLVDAWFAAWAQTDADARLDALTRIASPEVRVQDRFSCLTGIEDVTHHIAAAQRFMPGMRLQRQGDARHVQGTVLVDWIAAGPDGEARGRGASVFGLGPDGRIERVTGFWM
jgi:uncharacterized protein YndB with AHSA1/START domain